MDADIKYRGGLITTQQANNLTVHTFKDTSGADHITVPEHSIFLIESDTTTTDVWEGQCLPQRDWEAGAVQFLPARTSISSIYVGRTYTESMIRLPERALVTAARGEIDLDRIEMRFAQAPAGDVYGITKAFMNLIRSPAPPPLLIESMTVSIAVAVLCALAPETTRAIYESKQGLTYAKLRRVQEYIEENLTRPITLGEMAGVVHMSVFHFIRSFKHATGYTPVRYVLKRRVEKAKRMLTVTDMQVGAVGFACGFNNQSHFTSTFKKLTGMTPAEWRRAN
jgi:AraC family transcriptional regulator